MSDLTGQYFGLSLGHLGQLQPMAGFTTFAKVALRLIQGQAGEPLGVGAGSIPGSIGFGNRSGSTALDAADSEEGGRNECLNGNGAVSQVTRTRSSTDAVLLNEPFFDLDYLLVQPASCSCFLTT